MYPAILGTLLSSFRIGKTNPATISAAALTAARTHTLPDATGTLALLSDVVATDLSQNVALSGEITPAQIAVDVNDYNPTGLATASTLRLSSSKAVFLTGIAGGTDGRLLILHNVGLFPIYIMNSSNSSSAANRFLLPVSQTMGPHTSVTLQYDSTSNRWRGLDTLLMNAIQAVGSGGINIGSLSAIQVSTVQLGFLTSNQPSIITADQNDYTFGANVNTTSVWRIKSDATRNITGIAEPGVNGFTFFLHNVGANNIVLKSEDAASSGPNRFSLNGDLTLAGGDSCILQWTTTDGGSNSRWFCVGRSSGGAGGWPTAMLTASIAGSGTQMIDWAAYGSANLTLTGSMDTHTVTFSNIKAGQEITAYVDASMAMMGNLNWPDVKWEGGSPPSMTNGIAVYKFFSTGTTVTSIVGRRVATNVS